ncbi:MAG TPA: hypothetical protein VH951_01050 [Dehalococcoidia bacterium]
MSAFAAGHGRAGMPDDSTYALRLESRPRALRLPLPAVGPAIAAALAGVALLTAATVMLDDARTGSQPSHASVASSAANASSASIPAVDIGASPPAPAVQPPTVADAPAAVSAAPALVSETSAVVAAAPQVPAAQAQAVASQAQAAAPVAAAPVTEAGQSQPGQRWLAEGFVFVTQGQDWDDASFKNVDAALATLPQRIRAQLGNRSLGGLSILVNRTGTALSGKQPYGGAANFFSTNDGHNELVLFPDQSVLTTLHELGHAYNLRRIAAGRYALALLDPETQSFMAATGWRVLSTPDQVRAARDQIEVQYAYDGAFMWPRLSHNDPLEDFANSFALYFYSPGDLQKVSPERFAWFEANVGQ